MGLPEYINQGQKMLEYTRSIVTSVIGIIRGFAELVIMMFKEIARFIPKKKNKEEASIEEKPEIP